MSNVYIESISGNVSAVEALSGAIDSAQTSHSNYDIYSAPSRALAVSVVSEHDVDITAHNDIRIFLQKLSKKLNALADSDDTTLDQLSEIVEYIKANRELIDTVTTSKVSVSDIVNDLSTNVSNKPLSAAQGVVLKQLIDAITIPSVLPNPKALTFTGAVQATYDGSAPISVQIKSHESDDLEIDYGCYTIDDNIASASVLNIEIPFSRTFSGVPKVFTTFMTNSSAYAFGNATTAVGTAVTTSNFIARIYNNSGAARLPYLMWIAVYSPSVEARIATAE